MDNISIEKIWQDEVEDLYEIRVIAKSKYVSATTDIYMSDISDILSLANDLSIYPQNGSEYYWQAYQKNVAGKNLSFCIMPKDRTGHLLIRINIVVDCEEFPKERYNCSFCIETEIGLLNTFGRSLSHMSQLSVGAKINLVNLE